jgi:replicative DNA helicase
MKSNGSNLTRVPNAPEAEQALLSSIMQGGDSVIAAVLDSGGSDSGLFYNPVLKGVFTALCDRFKANEPVNDLILLTGILRSQIQPAELTSIYTLVPSTGNWRYYLDELKDKQWLRECIRISTENVRRAMESNADANEIVKLTENTLLDLSRRRLNGHCSRTTIKEIVEDVLTHMDTPQALGISTGFPSLDEVVGGFCAGEKIVIAGPMKGGKSAFAENLADSFAVCRNIPTAIFSFEMSARQVVQRLIQIRSGVSTRSIARGQADLMATQNYGTAASEIAKAPLFIIKDRLDVAGIRARCLQLKASDKLVVAIIDYVQIIPEPRTKGESTVERLDRVSIGTKQIADQLGLIVIELSQLTETKDGKFNTKWSSGITADCDKRLDIGGNDDDGKDVIDKNIHVSYQREGPKGYVDFRFHKPTTRFKEKKRQN